MSNLLDDFSPIIEFVDVVKNNPYDMGKKSYYPKKDPVTVIKWCRRNFGQRGDGWDFVGGVKQVEIIIWSSKLIVMWELWQE